MSKYETENELRVKHARDAISEARNLFELGNYTASRDKLFEANVIIQSLELLETPYPKKVNEE